MCGNFVRYLRRSRLPKSGAQLPEMVSVMGKSMSMLSPYDPVATLIVSLFPAWAMPCATVRHGATLLVQSFAVSPPAVDTKRSAARAVPTLPRTRRLASTSRNLLRAHADIEDPPSEPITLEGENVSVNRGVCGRQGKSRSEGA